MLKYILALRLVQDERESGILQYEKQFLLIKNTLKKYLAINFCIYIYYYFQPVIL